MTFNSKTFLVTATLLFSFLSGGISSVNVSAATPKFDPSYILDDSSFSSKRAFPTQDSVQKYLDKMNSPLARYSAQAKPASYWIFAASNGTTNTYMGIKPNLNPGLILTMLEKEQSLISMRNYDTNRDPESRIKSAMGMGCPDDSKCSDVYSGFVNQINWGAFQLQYNFEKAKTKSGDNYKVGSTIKTLDGFSVKLSNAATASAYRYTPNVYYGNYNLWKIMTANGWGVTSQTYSYSELDRQNPKLNPSSQPSSPFKSNLPEVESTSKYTPPSTQLSSPSTGSMRTMYINQNSGASTSNSNNQTSNSNSSLSLEKFDCSSLKRKEWIYGQTSENIRNLQVCMQAAGTFTWQYGATGYYGDATKDALMAWRGYL